MVLLAPALEDLPLLCGSLSLTPLACLWALAWVLAWVALGLQHPLLLPLLPLLVLGAVLALGLLALGLLALCCLGFPFIFLWGIL